MLSPLPPTSHVDVRMLSTGNAEPLAPRPLPLSPPLPLLLPRMPEDEGSQEFPRCPPPSPLSLPPTTKPSATLRPSRGTGLPGTPALGNTAEAAVSLAAKEPSADQGRAPAAPPTATSAKRHCGRRRSIAKRISPPHALVMIIGQTFDEADADKSGTVTSREALALIAGAGAGADAAQGAVGSLAKAQRKWPELWALLKSSAEGGLFARFEVKKGNAHGKGLSRSQFVDALEIELTPVCSAQHVRRRVGEPAQRDCDARL